MTPKKKKHSLTVLSAGGLLVTIAAYYCAAAMSPGRTVFIWMEEMKKVLENPFQTAVNEYTLRTVAIFLAVYALLMMMYLTGRRNYLPGREMGSAEYADVKMVNRKLADHHNKADDPGNIVIRPVAVRRKFFRETADRHQKEERRCL